MAVNVNGRTHDYHAEATIVSGSLQLPLAQEIQPQARLALPQTGGYNSQYAETYGLQGVISYESAYTQVAGNLDTKPGHGWTTLTTSVIEGLNILEVVTADRIVGQIITEYPLEGYVPTVNFLGTRFENLRIAGNPIDIEMNLGILGDKPAGDGSYTGNAGVKDRVASQYKHLLDHGNFPVGLRERYNRLSSNLRGAETVECSLVNRVTGSFPGSSFGHIIDIPQFGKVTLCKLTVTSEDMLPGTQTPRKTTVALTMMDLDLGCVTSGKILVSPMVTNGQSNP
jgi:hypothetical protein